MSGADSTNHLKWILSSSHPHLSHPLYAPSLLADTHPSSDPPAPASDNKPLQGEQHAQKEEKADGKEEVDELGRELAHSAQVSACTHARTNAHAHALT